MQAVNSFFTYQHHWLDSPWTALAFLRICVHSSLSRAAFFQFLTSSVLTSSHRNFGLLTLLKPSGFVSLTTTQIYNNSPQADSHVLWSKSSHNFILSQFNPIQNTGLLCRSRHLIMLPSILRWFLRTPQFIQILYTFLQSNIHSNRWCGIRRKTRPFFWHKICFCLTARWQHRLGVFEKGWLTGISGSEKGGRNRRKQTIS